MTLRMVLAGAPDPERLSWDEHLLLRDWVPPVARFLNSSNGKSNLDVGEGEQQEEELAVYRWRSIPLSKNGQLRTGMTQEMGALALPQFHGIPTQRSVEMTLVPSSQDSLPAPNTQYLRQMRGEDRSQGTNDADEEESRFHEYSMAVHDSMTMSQLEPSLTPLEESTILESFHSDMYGEQSTTSVMDGTPADARLPRAIKNLCEMPNSAYLKRIVPQTIVVNLIVGVISIIPPHSKQTRYGMREMAEILVGDETGIGFKITFWFSARESQRVNGFIREAAPDPLRDALESLRLQDVVLIENVALDSFRDKVFGSSLRKSIQRNQTRLQLLARHGVNKMGGLDGVEKVARVKEWVEGFVNPHRDAANFADGARGGPLEIALPPDTQD
ncbi:hypothetical protein HDK90DRAFT_509436 [Phyllosticta capitalensis]|uniref:Uncharacterized protein n=1 Tax=Phyllosticta capitalensis TaxID=121624 RepID=A0ABR1YRX6_9PEZI